MIKFIHDFTDGKQRVGKNKVGTKMQGTVCKVTLAIFPGLLHAGAEVLNVLFTDRLGFNKSSDMYKLTSWVVWTMHPGSI